MSSSEKKKQKTTPNPSLPDDLILEIVARISKLYYPNLSLVSKSFRSLLVSPELYKARSLLGRAESFLYLYFRNSQRQHDTRWFSLCLTRDQTLCKNKESSRYVSATLPIHHSLPAQEPWTLVAVGSDIYYIGVSRDQASLCSVSILDCRSHTWREAPSFPVELVSISACVLDRKIYVAGSCKEGNFNPLEKLHVFDTATQIWDLVLSRSCNDTNYNWHSHRSFCIDGKVHMVTCTDMVAYNSKECSFDLVSSGRGMYGLLGTYTYCVIENILYCVFRCQKLIWYDSEVKTWRDLKGLVELPEFHNSYPCHRLVDYGGKMAVFWERRLHYRVDHYRTKMVWCAVITLKKSNNCEIWGNVEWFGHVFTVPRTCHLERAFAATI